MIQASKLLNAIRNRVQIWSFQDIYSNSKEAKKAAAKLFTTQNGVVVKQTGKSSFVVMYWSPNRVIEE